MENGTGDLALQQGLALQQLFPYKSDSFKNSHCSMMRASNLGDCGIFDALFPFLAFFKL